MSDKVWCGKCKKEFARSSLRLYDVTRYGPSHYAWVNFFPKKWRSVLLCPKCYKKSQKLLFIILAIMMLIILAGALCILIPYF
jgi:uncharacterized membrane protein YfhO